MAITQPRPHTVPPVGAWEMQRPSYIAGQLVPSKVQSPPGGRLICGSPLPDVHSIVNDEAGPATCMPLCSGFHSRFGLPKSCAGFSCRDVERGSAHPKPPGLEHGNPSDMFSMFGLRVISEPWNVRATRFPALLASTWEGLRRGDKRDHQPKP